MHFGLDRSTGSNRVRLYIDELNVENKAQLEQYLVFNASTFSIIRTADKDPEGFDHIFKAVNYVFNKLTEEEKIKIAMFFAHANYCVKDTLGKFKDKSIDVVGRSIVEFSGQLGEQYLQLIKETGLVDKFREYCDTQIHMQDMGDCGSRPQDTKELTFTPIQMRETNVIACFSKLASPIFGEIINNLPSHIDENGKKKLPRDKEYRCVSLVRPLISEYFAEIQDKLQGYVHHIVTSLTSKEHDGAAIFYGLTTSTRTSMILSSLLVRNYVIVELEKPDSNIVRYTDTLVRTLTQTQNVAAHKSQVRTRKAPGSTLASDDSNNVDQMEVDSLVSDGTMDGPILVATAIDDVVKAHRRQLDISRADFQKCLDYFKEHPFKQTPLNKLVITAVFGQEIGGGSGIDMNDNNSYTKLVAMLQLMALSMGYIQLAVFLTATKSNEVKMQLSLEEENFKRQATTLSHYRACREIFSKSTVSLGDQMWDRQMQVVLEDMASSIYYVNVPDYILEMVPEDSNEPIGSFIENGQVLIPDIETSEELCGLIQTYSQDIAEE